MRHEAARTLEPPKNRLKHIKLGTAPCIQAVLAMKQNSHESRSYDQIDSSRNLRVVPVWLPL